MSCFQTELQVQEAAVIGVPHPKWTERPLLIIVKTKDSDLSKEKMLSFLKACFADLKHHILDHCSDGIHYILMTKPQHKPLRYELDNSTGFQNFMETITASAYCCKACLDKFLLLQGKVAKWWIPEDCVFVKEIPHTAAGKISKLQLRKQFKDYKAPKPKM